MEIGRLWKELEREALSTPTLCDLPIITFFTCQKQFSHTNLEIDRLWKELEREALFALSLCDLLIITFFPCQKQLLYTNGNRPLVKGTGEGSPLRPLSL